MIGGLRMTVGWLALLLAGVPSGVSAADSFTLDTPAIDPDTGTVAPVRAATHDAMELIAEHNVDFCSEELAYLMVTRTHFILPSMAVYARDQTAENWRLALDEIVRTRTRLAAAAQSALAYNGGLATSIPHLAEIAEGRNALLFQMPEAGPDTRFVNDWALHFRPLVLDLQSELHMLRQRLATTP